MIESNEIPIEILDLVRFLAHHRTKSDKYFCDLCETVFLCDIPVMPYAHELEQIGDQDFDDSKLCKAIEWLVSHTI
jgi:hypothetical protein